MPSDSFLDQIKAFGARLGLPKVDVDKLVEISVGHRGRGKSAC